MRGRYKQLEGKERVYGSAHPVSQPPGSAAHTAYDVSIQEADDWETGTKTCAPKKYKETRNEFKLAQEIEQARESAPPVAWRSWQSLSSSPVSPEYTSETNGTGYNSDESDEIIPSPPSHTIYSPGTAEYQQTLPPPEAMVTSFQPAWIRDYWFTNCPVSSSEFFWAQLQKEEIKLRNISDEALLATDKHSRTALHSVVCDGKRVLAYAIAKRMAPLNSLDLKDSNGMTALLLAAKHNHHLIVEDLINLGARVSERNNSGKSCLHLSAEKGFIRVLEVLKRVMMEGVYIDVEATDKSGMSVLQCASVALKVTLQQLELRKSLNHTKPHTLRKEQLLKTLECLLQMASYSHVMGTWGKNA
ncbi:NF-kappa-B inhibitor zeta isoform X6 [Phycodurus eques]|uniref:NF-kappa-B inhibitor zeta isoform X6 n=1 Tax=Phycodurus eques TaxID=693459 RepID=UPI002ACE677A|nr:NF-kappa-B inhibitor zeta isoform X6 [Phycodurus eques]